MSNLSYHLSIVNFYNNNCTVFGLSDYDRNNIMKISAMDENNVLKVSLNKIRDAKNYGILNSNISFYLSYNLKFIN